MARDGVVDTSLLLSLGEASALGLLRDDPDHRWHITPIVRGEVLSEPTRSEISRVILDGRLATTELDPDSATELGAFARWSDRVYAGEAEAIAVAVSRGWVVGIEDLFAQRCISREVGGGGLGERRGAAGCGGQGRAPVGFGRGCDLRAAGLLSGISEARRSESVRPAGTTNATMSHFAPSTGTRKCVRGWERRNGGQSGSVSWKGRMWVGSDQPLGPQRVEACCSRMWRATASA